jgi:hypothetical protein
MNMANVTFVDTKINAVLAPGQSTEWVWNHMNPLTGVWSVNAAPLKVDAPFAGSQVMVEVTRQWRVLRVVEDVQQPLIVEDFHYIVQNNGSDTVNYTVFISIVSP